MSAFPSQVPYQTQVKEQTNGTITDEQWGKFIIQAHIGSKQELAQHNDHKKAFLKILFWNILFSKFEMSLDVKIVQRDTNYAKKIKILEKLGIQQSDLQELEIVDGQND